MDIKQLKYFIEVADTRNLSRAAENLCISQPTLSLAMKKIETELNIKVFDTKVKYGLSPAGQILYDRGSEIVRNFERLISEVENYCEDDNETIRVGITILFVVQFMNEISSFIDKHQYINLHIIQNGSINLQKKLVKGDVDVAILSLPNHYPDEIEINHFQNSKIGYNVAVVMPKSNPLSQKSSVTIDDLKEQKFSNLSEDFIIGGLLYERSQELGFKPDIIFKHDDLNVLMESVLERDTVCLLPMEYRDVSDMDNLAWVPLKDEKTFFEIGIGHTKSSKKTHGVVELIETLEKL